MEERVDVMELLQGHFLFKVLLDGRFDRKLFVSTAEFNFLMSTSSIKYCDLAGFQLTFFLVLSFIQQNIVMKVCYAPLLNSSLDFADDSCDDFHQTVTPSSATSGYSKCTNIFTKNELFDFLGSHLDFSRHLVDGEAINCDLQVRKRRRRK